MSPLLVVVLCMAVPQTAEKKIGGVNLKCGAYCLYVGLRSLDVPVGTYEELEKTLGPPGNHGYSMEDLAGTARKLGAYADGVETSLDRLSYRKGRFACIALVERGHFVILYDYDRDKGVVHIIDPPEKREIQADAFRDIWTKKALLVSDKPLEAEESIRPPLNLGLIAACFMASLASLMLGVAFFRFFRGRVASAVLVLWVVSGCGGTQPAGTNGLPRLMLDPEVVDFTSEAVDGGTLLDAEVTIHNAGTELLRIFSVASSCGCTVVKAPSTIAPGGSDVLHMHVQAGYQNGPRSSHVTLQTNDPQHPSMALPARWVVGRSLQLEPSLIDFGIIRPGQDVQQPVRVMLLEKLARTGLQVRGLTPGMSAEWTENLDRGKVRTLLIAARGNEQPGTYHATLELSDKDEALLATLRVRWEVTARLAAHPAAVFRSGVRPGETARFDVLVVSETRELFAIQDARLDGYTGNVSFDREAGRAVRHRVGLEVKAPEQDGVFRMVLRITTDLNGGPVLEVPCSLVVRG
jgi:hypothetical protein